MTDDQTIDACLVTYGCGPLTLLALQTLVTTTPSLGRIVLVDNGAGDDALSHARLQDWMGDRLLYLPRPDNPGVYIALNQALAETTARYVLIGSSDMFPMPGWLPPVISGLQQQTHGIAWLGPGQIEGPFDLQKPWDALADLHRVDWLIDPRPNTGFGIVDWHRLRDVVGPFDERFFFTYGDTDYLQRMAEVGLMAASLQPARVLHLVQQSRKLVSAARNVDLEMADEAAFHAKYADRPEVLARHPTATREARLAEWTRVHGDVKESA